jgi:hypothetical protein
MDGGDQGLPPGGLNLDYNAYVPRGQATWAADGARRIDPSHADHAITRLGS